MINQKSQIKLTGLQGLGKSYFLSDFVLRHRFQGNSSNFRFLYVNNSHGYLGSPMEYLLNELKYMLCFDFSDDLIRTKFIDLYWDADLKNLLNFLKFLNKYYFSKGKKLVLIWDQINPIFGETKYQKALNIFIELIDQNIYFDCIILSASNENKEIHHTLAANYYQIEINPLDVFTQKEIYQLLKNESSLYKPMDKKIEDLVEYSLDLCKIINYSIAEYFFYKKSNWELFPKKKAITLLLNYAESRNKFIQDSEQKFQQKKVKSRVELISYYEAMRKLLTIEEFQNLNPEDKVVF